MGRALVAMSGGVDSSVAAVMLHEEGYEVVGITMKTWSHDGPATAPNGKAIGCCTLDAMNDARAVALRYGFAHFIVDIREEFGAAVVEPFARGYLAGETPNPCILCNTHIKWAALLRRADALGCEVIATGHYAREGTRAAEDGTVRHTIRRGLDAAKDQSYVLWGLPQAHLARSRFPIGSHAKPEIRRMAAEWGLDAVAAKPDSYEICFVPEGDYRDFLRRRDPGLDARVGGGPLVLTDGTVVGRHRGHPFYTVGQRRGLEIALGYPAYVTAIDASTNTVTVGPREALMRHRARRARRQLGRQRRTARRDARHRPTARPRHRHRRPRMVGRRRRPHRRLLRAPRDGHARPGRRPLRRRHRPRRCLDRHRRRAGGIGAGDAGGHPGAGVRSGR